MHSAVACSASGRAAARPSIEGCATTSPASTLRSTSGRAAARPSIEGPRTRTSEAADARRQAGQLPGPPLKGVRRADVGDGAAASGRAAARPSIEGRSASRAAVTGSGQAGQLPGPPLKAANDAWELVPSGPESGRAAARPSIEGRKEPSTPATTSTRQAGQLPGPPLKDRRPGRGAHRCGHVRPGSCPALH